VTAAISVNKLFKYVIDEDYRLVEGPFFSYEANSISGWKVRSYMMESVLFAPLGLRKIKIQFYKF
jgi:hypothetical protein